jgi:DNA-binding winged helix-turn-helix (wHTH) protein/TolB-like protein/Tfp pilus assembly protein PilF
MVAATGRTYRIGDFVVDPDRFRITRGDAVVAVEPKVFDLLVHLIRHRDRVLTREELFEAIWEGRPVSDATLSNHVKNARRALGDNGELQGTIQTVRGRGYRFVAPVEELGADHPAPGPGPGPGPAPAPAPAATVASAATATAAAEVADGGSAALPETARTRRATTGWRLAAGLAVLLLSLAAFVGYRTVVDARTPAPTDRPYVLVVPFGVSENATAYHRTFADQLTREVIASLRKISGLRTVPQATAFHFRDDPSPEHVVANVPGVRFLLSGEVSVAPDGTLRIAPRLTDLREDLDVWDSAFRVRVDERDFFRTPAEIARAVAAALKVEIVRDEQRALAALPTVPAAYGPYATGWREMEQFTHESLTRAVAAFDEAIARDPDFLAAHRARSDALRIIFTYFEEPRKLLPVVEGSLRDVLAREPDDAEAFSSLGLTQVMAWQWRDAWDNLDRARSLDVSLAQTELGFALYYAALGERDRVRASIARANALDPLNTELADWGTWALFMVGELDAARAWARERMREHPDNGFVFCGAGISAYLSGDTAEAVTLLEKGVELTDRAPVALIMLAQGYGYAGRTERVQPLLAEAEAARIYMCPYETAVAYLTLGDEASRARAMALLEEAADKRSNCLIFLRVDPRIAALRDDPRFAGRMADLMKRVGLDDATVRTYRR